MTVFRHHRFRIGIFLAALIFAAAALPGLVAAAQGVQIQALLCSPDGAQPGHDSGSEPEIFDHCQICPLAGSYSADARNWQGGLIRPYQHITELLSKDTGTSAPERSELSPLNGRAPPARG